MDRGEWLKLYPRLSVSIWSAKSKRILKLNQSWHTLINSLLTPLKQASSPLLWHYLPLQILMLSKKTIALQTLTRTKSYPRKHRKNLLLLLKTHKNSRSLKEKFLKRKRKTLNKNSLEMKMYGKQKNKNLLCSKNKPLLKSYLKKIRRSRMKKMSHGRILVKRTRPLRLTSLDSRLSLMNNLKILIVRRRIQLRQKKLRKQRNRLRLLKKQRRKRRRKNRNLS